VRNYAPQLKRYARTLRANQTESEQHLWSKLRGKQLLGVQFYRQKPLGNYIVDFYAPKASLVIEIDGSQHQDEGQTLQDIERDRYLEGLGLTVLRFDSRQVLVETETVVATIFASVAEKLKN
jgi:very-short-patch-repair endonuclease